jgi:hypothetical protein
MQDEGYPLPMPILVLFFALAIPGGCLAQGGFELLNRDRLKDATPRDFYLEGSAVPVERRNAVLMESPSGTRVLVALVVTSGFASQSQHKYAGMLISEGSLTVCRNPVSIGSYGFGLRRPAPPSAGDAEFILYNQAGQRMWECVARKDLNLREPRPLQAILDTPDSARVYLGRYWVELRR